MGTHVQLDGVRKNAAKCGKIAPPQIMPAMSVTESDCMSTATSTTMNELQLRHLHGFLQVLNLAHLSSSTTGVAKTTCTTGASTTWQTAAAESLWFSEQAGPWEFASAARRETFDELQLQHQHGFLHCLTISLSLRNNGRVNIHQELHLSNLRSSAQFGTVRSRLWFIPAMMPSIWA